MSERTVLLTLWCRWRAEILTWSPHPSHLSKFVLHIWKTYLEYLNLRYRWETIQKLSCAALAASNILERSQTPSHTVCDRLWCSFSKSWWQCLSCVLSFWNCNCATCTKNSICLSRQDVNILSLHFDEKIWRHSLLRVSKLPKCTLHALCEVCISVSNIPLGMASGISGASVCCWDTLCQLWKAASHGCEPWSVWLQGRWLHWSNTSKWLVGIWAGHKTDFAQEETESMRCRQNDESWKVGERLKASYLPLRASISLWFWHESFPART